MHITYNILYITVEPFSVRVNDLALLSSPKDILIIETVQS